MLEDKSNPTEKDEVQYIHFRHCESDQKPNIPNNIEPALYSIRESIENLNRTIKKLIEIINTDEESIGEKLGILIEDLSTLKSNEFNG